MTHVLHVSDNNLLLQSLAQGGDHGVTVARSQGYAWLKGDQVLFDINSESSPVAHCRLAPQQINSRYWQQCAQTAISDNGAGMRHAADLIWKHLAELKAKFDLESLVLVVPANYRDPHLQLLLGVAKAAGLDILALISKPVLAVQQHLIDANTALHVDVQLHQTVISTLAIDGTDIRLVDVDIKPELGIQSMQESLLHALQNNFIRSDRFDPLHDADTEQQLFNQLPNIVQSAVKGEKSNVGVQHQGKLYSTVIDSSESEAALAGMVTQLRELRAPQLLVDMNASFNFSDLSSLASQNIRWVSDDCPAPSAAAIAGKNEQGNVVYQTTLPNLGDRPSQTSKERDSAVEQASVTQAASQVDQPVKQSMVSSSANAEQPTATHLVQLGLAIRVDQASITTDGAVLKLVRSDTSSPASSMAELLGNGGLQIINDQDRTELLANDRLMSPVADGVITAITLLS